MRLLSWEGEELPHLILSALKGQRLTLEEVVSKLKEKGALKVNFIDVLNALIKLEKEDLVERIRDSDYSPSRPVTTVKWFIRAERSAPLTQLAPDEVVIAASTPLINLLGGRDLMSILDAAVSLILSAEQGVYIATPYADATLSTIIAQHYQKVAKLAFVRVLVDISESNVAMLERLKFMLPNLEYALVGEYAVVEVPGVGSRRFKVRGLHLKALAVDKKSALVGSFNFKEPHVTCNYDVALLLRGKAAELVWDMMESLWHFCREHS
ncbi:MAG: phospholipase D-like domain-containing protein [Nitrososphaerota archaeon]